MQFDILSYDPEGTPPSLCISYDGSDQCHYVHKDYPGPCRTLVRLCLLRLYDSDLLVSTHAIQCFQELQALGRPNPNGTIYLRHNPAATSLLDALSRFARDSGPTLYTPQFPE